MEISVKLNEIKSLDEVLVLLDVLEEKKISIKFASLNKKQEKKILSDFANIINNDDDYDLRFEDVLTKLGFKYYDGRHDCPYDIAYGLFYKLTFDEKCLAYVDLLK